MSPREISLIFLPKYLLLLTDHINVRTSCKTLYMMCKNVYFQCFSLPEQFLLSVGYFFFSFLIPMASLLIFLFSQLDSAFLLRCWLTINITLTMLTIYCILVMIFLFGQIMLELLEMALFFFQRLCIHNFSGYVMRLVIFFVTYFLDNEYCLLFCGLKNCFCILFAQYKHFELF